MDGNVVITRQNMRGNNRLVLDIFDGEKNVKVVLSLGSSAGEDHLARVALGATVPQAWVYRLEALKITPVA